jgi:hypothetical protein
MNQRVRRAVAIYEMLTCVAVVLNVGAGLSAISTEIPLLVWLMVAVVLVLASASLVAGVLLWRDMPDARQLSMFVQAIQVPRIAIAGAVEYAVSLGLSFVLNVGVEPVSMRMPVHLVTGLGKGTDGFYLGVNVLALTALVLVARWRQATDAEILPPIEAA